MPDEQDLPSSVREISLTWEYRLLCVMPDEQDLRSGVGDLPDLGI